MSFTVSRSKLPCSVSTKAHVNPAAARSRGISAERKFPNPQPSCSLPAWSAFLTEFSRINMKIPAQPVPHASEDLRAQIFAWIRPEIFQESIQIVQRAIERFIHLRAGQHLAELPFTPVEGGQRLIHVREHAREVPIRVLILQRSAGLRHLCPEVRDGFAQIAHLRENLIVLIVARVEPPGCAFAPL